MLVEEARELLFLGGFFHCCGDYLFGQFPFDVLPFKRKLLRIWQCLWLIVVWQWCSSEVAASRKITIQTWQKLADIFVRVKHRAQRQIYHKNQYHKLLGCHCLFIMAARATISPELLSCSCTGTWHYPKGEIFAGYNSQKFLLLAGSPGFIWWRCKAPFGPKRSKELSCQQLYPGLVQTENELLMRRACILADRHGHQARTNLLERCSLLSWFASHISDFSHAATAVCVTLCAHLWCGEISL